MINHELPVVELHRHLDGAIRPETIFHLARKHKIDALANLPWRALLERVQIHDRTSDLLSFLSRLDHGVSVLADYDACYQVAFENIEDAFIEHIDHIELRFSPHYMAMAHQLDMRSVIEAVVEGCTDAAQKYGVSFGLIGILSRTFGVDRCRNEMEAILAFHDRFVACDLAGDEQGFPAKIFTELFMEIRSAGLEVTVHAGEADGPQSIWQALDELGAVRIGHGFRAIEDAVLVDRLVVDKVCLEICPTSNYQTGTWVDTARHPCRELFERGVPITLSTDDPGVSNITLHDEYQIANNLIGFSPQQLEHIQLNSLNFAFLSQQQLNELRQKKSALSDC